MVGQLDGAGEEVGDGLASEELDAPMLGVGESDGLLHALTASANAPSAAAISPRSTTLAVCAVPPGGRQGRAAYRRPARSGGQ